MRKVRFSVSTKYVGSQCEEIFTLDELGIDENLQGEALENAIHEAHQDWMFQTIDFSYGIIEE